MRINKQFYIIFNDLKNNKDTVVVKIISVFYHKKHKNINTKKKKNINKDNKIR